MALFKSRALLAVALLAFLAVSVATVQAAGDKPDELASYTLFEGQVQPARHLLNDKGKYEYDGKGKYYMKNGKKVYVQETYYNDKGGKYYIKYGKKIYVK